MNKICLGCGVVLQTDDELEPGFIPKEKINDSNYCKRCFRLTHYGEKNNNEEEKSISYILNKVNKDNIFKIYLVDLLNINNNTIELFNKIKGNKLLLISKLDLISDSININHIVDNIRKVYNIKSDIKTISVDNIASINSLINYINKNNINKTYLLGPTNSGKSTLINKLLEINETDTSMLTMSNKRNTTLDFIDVAINKNLTIIDSPGFLINDYNLKSKYKNVIKPISFNMKDGEILLINNFYIKFKDSSSITIYNYDKLNITKYYKDIKFDYDIDMLANTDLCINGFGFIRIKNSNKLYIYNLNKELISIRRSII